MWENAGGAYSRSHTRGILDIYVGVKGIVSKNIYVGVKGKVSKNIYVGVKGIVSKNIYVGDKGKVSKNEKKVLCNQSLFLEFHCY